MVMRDDRRSFIRRVALGGLAATGLTAIGGCAQGSFDFLHGVASGDPLADRVILWTRLTPDDALLESIDQLVREAPHDRRAAEWLAELQHLPVAWLVATDAQCRQVVRRGVTFTGAAQDHTVKVDVTGLQPGTSYFYRFHCLGQASPIGRTRTLPRAGVRRVRLAVFSCSNYPAGFFNAYAAAAQLDDVDAAVHLGDYIYEYDRDGYASQRAEQLGRVSLPAHELLTLADYRARHAQYKGDPALQAAHAAMPFITVWDDHEIANDAWRDGAQNHDPASEGSWPARRSAALQAYHEWMPTRLPQPGRPERIFRSFDFGDLVSLHMLDTRLIGRERQLNLGDYVGTTGFDTARFAAALSDPSRQLLGGEQLAWLQTQMARSQATWQVLGQQVLMARMNVPLPLLLLQIGVSAYAALVDKARTRPAELTPQELAILQAPAIPYNLDAWDGYAAARESVLGIARSLDRNLISLAGDTHNAWASDLRDAGGAAVGVEFATSSVSSPGFEDVFPEEEPAAFAAALQALIEPLVYCDTSRRGFMVLTCTPGEAQADWHYVDTVFAPGAGAAIGRSLRTLPGAAGRRLVEA